MSAKSVSELTSVELFICGMAEAVADCGAFPDGDGDLVEFGDLWGLCEDWALGCLKQDMLNSAALREHVAPVAAAIEKRALPIAVPYVDMVNFGYSFALCVWSDSNPFDGLTTDSLVELKLYELCCGELTYGWYDRHELWAEENTDGDLRPRFEMV